jgi:hypothetical protein
VSDDERALVVDSGEKRADGCLERVVRCNEEGASEQLKRFCDARISTSRQRLTCPCQRESKPSMCVSQRTKHFRDARTSASSSFDVLIPVREQISSMGISLVDREVEYTKADGTTWWNELVH